MTLKSTCLFIFALLVLLASADPALAQGDDTPAITVISPNGGESFELGAPITIAWTSANVPSVRVDFSLDGIFYRPVATVAATDGSLTFTPDAHPTNAAMVRVMDVRQPHVGDTSDNPFRILASPSIMIFAPTTSEQLMRGATYTISFAAERVQRVNIRYSTNGGATYTLIAGNIDARQGQYTWTVPNQATSQARIRIDEVGGPTFAETGIFSVIEPMPMVRVIRPNGGEQYFVGEQINVLWTAADVSTITLSYSSDGGVSWTQFAGPMNATLGQFAWTSGLPAGSYRIRIESNSGQRDDSDADFIIIRRLEPRITVTYPNGGELLAVDSVVRITWTSQDVTADVAVQYSVDRGATWKPAGAGTAPAAAGALTWTAPDDTTSLALVRVINAEAGDTSDAVFAIVERDGASLIVVTPNGGERWRETDTAHVRWTSNGVMNVDIALSTDGGASWTWTIAQKVPAAGGLYTWRVPRLADTSLSSLLLRITASENPTLADASNGTFDFIASVIATAESIVERNAVRSSAVPNPFSDATEIRWHQARRAPVSVLLFNQAGALVLRAQLGVRESGQHAHVLNGASIPGGLYVYEVQMGDSSARGVVSKAR